MFAVATLSAQAPDVPETFPKGVVYGPKAAFAIAAPNGWVLDNKTGAADGLPCVLYPKDTTWQTAPVVMYAKIASTTHEDAKEFIKVAIEHMTKERPGFTHRQVAAGKTNEGLEWVINEYPASESYPRVERGLCADAEGGGIYRDERGECGCGRALCRGAGGCDGIVRVQGGVHRVQAAGGGSEGEVVNVGRDKGGVATFPREGACAFLSLAVN